MKLFLADPRGFCAGVTRAINTVEKALEIYKTPLYVRHEIVHNINVLNNLISKGVIFVDDINDIPDGSNVILSAHGSAKNVFEEAKQKKLNVIDACCPLVGSVHKYVSRLDRDGYDVILIGNKNHQEVIGTVGQITNDIIIIDNDNDAREIEVKNPDKVGYVTQTTLNFDDTKTIISILKERFPKIVGLDKSNICYATKNRQDVVKNITEYCDLMLIVGSKNSSNATKLKNIGLLKNKQSYLIDSKDDIKKEWFENVASVGLSAGASTPEYLTQDVISYLTNEFGAVLQPVVSGVKEDIFFPLPAELEKLAD